MRLPGSRTMSCIAMRRTTCIVRQSSQRHVPVITYSACNITKHHHDRACKQRALPPCAGAGRPSALSRRIDWTARRGWTNGPRFIWGMPRAYSRARKIKRKLENGGKSQPRKPREIRQLSSPAPRMHSAKRTGVFQLYINIGILNIITVRIIEVRTREYAYIHFLVVVRSTGAIHFAFINSNGGSGAKTILGERNGGEESRS